MRVLASDPASSMMTSEAAAPGAKTTSATNCGKPVASVILAFAKRQNARREPSGDQDGSISMSGPEVNCSRPEPSAIETQMSPLESKAMRPLPTTAGGDGLAPTDRSAAPMSARASRVRAMAHIGRTANRRRGRSSGGAEPTATLVLMGRNLVMKGGRVRARLVRRASAVAASTTRLGTSIGLASASQSRIVRSKRSSSLMTGVPRRPRQVRSVAVPRVRQGPNEARASRNAGVT